MKTNNFGDFKAEMIIDIMPIIGKYYGTDLPLSIGVELSTKVASHMDRIVRQAMKVKDKAEVQQKDAVKAK